MDRHPPAVEAPPESDLPRSRPTWARRLRAVGWPLALLVLGVGGLVMLLLPAPYPPLALGLLLLFALAVMARDARWSLSGGFPSLSALTGRSFDPVNLRLSAFFAWCAAGLMLLAGIGFRPSPIDEALTVPLLFALAGALSLGIAAWLAPPPPVFARPRDLPLTPAYSQGLPTVVGVGLLALLAHISSAKVRADGFAQPITNDVQFVLLVMGLGLVVWGLGGAPALDLRALRGRFDRRQGLPLLAIFALALGLRLWNLGDAIRGSVDEAVVLEGVGHAWRYQDAGLVTQVSDRLSATQLFPYWQTLAINLLGRSLESLRLVNAIIGALTIFAVYLLARELFDPRAGLIAALLLATFPPHLQFSRLAMAHIADPLFGTLAFAFLIRGLKQNRRLDWALCGVSLGLTQYFFEGGRLLFPPLLALTVLVLAILFRPMMRRYWHGLVVAGLVAFFTLAPVYYSLFTLGQPSTSRMNDSGALTLVTAVLRGQATPDQTRDFLNRLTFPFQLYVHQPEIVRYYGGNQPLILDWMVPLFLLGLAWLLWRARAPSILLLFWLFFAGLGNVLMRDIAIFPRFLVVFPALVLTLTVGLRYGLPLLFPGLRGRAVPAYALALLVALGQANYYFALHLPVYMAQLRSATPYDGIDAVLRARAIPPTTQVLLVGHPAYDAGVARIFDGFLSQRIDSMHLLSLDTADLTLEYLSLLPRDRSYAFFIAPGSDSAASLLPHLFEVEGPYFSPYADVPTEKMYALYLARWRPGSG